MFPWARHWSPSCSWWLRQSLAWQLPRHWCVSEKVDERQIVKPIVHWDWKLSRGSVHLPLKSTGNLNVACLQFKHWYISFDELSSETVNSFWLSWAIVEILSISVILYRSIFHKKYLFAAYIELRFWKCGHLLYRRLYFSSHHFMCLRQYLGLLKSTLCHDFPFPSVNLQMSFFQARLSEG